jgi:hypothetical protein
VVHADVPSIQQRTEQLRGRMDCRVKPGNDTVILLPCLNLVIARSERDEAIQLPAQASGLLRYRSQWRRENPTSRRLERPSFPHHHASEKSRLTKGRRSAERRMTAIAAQSAAARHFEGAPAFRRLTAALTIGYHPDGSAPEPGFLKARRPRCFAGSPNDALS